MDTLDAIFTRRSVRRFTNQPVPAELVEILLRAAMNAPSASNKQPWRFIVIDDRTMLEQITTFHPYAQMLKEAALAVLICGDETSQNQEGYWVEDCSAATQNLLLATHALGLGAVWLGIHPNRERTAKITAVCQLPETIHPVSLVAVGYPLEIPAPISRYNPAYVHHNHW
ncbi:MAG TPA: nitroreductase family protein [Anaerolineaceae bacterium]